MIKSFKSLINKKEEEPLSERDQKIATFSKLIENWNLENIQEYIRGRHATEVLSDIGMAAILKKFNTSLKDEKKMPSGKRREFEAIDRPERTKKGLDVVILIASQITLSAETLPLIAEFIEIYMDVIKDFDRQLSQTYEHKIKASYKRAELNALAKSQFKRELTIKYDN